MNHVEEPPPLDPAEQAVADALGSTIGVADLVRDELARIAVAAARPITSAEALFAAASDCLDGDESDHLLWPLVMLAEMLRSRAVAIQKRDHVDDAELRRVHKQRIADRDEIINVAWKAYYREGRSHRVAVTRAIDAAWPFIEAVALRDYTDRQVTELQDRYRRLENIHRLSVEAHRQYVAEHRQTCTRAEHQPSVDTDVHVHDWAEVEQVELDGSETRSCFDVPCPPYETIEIVSERPADTVETASRLCPPVVDDDEKREVDWPTFCPFDCDRCHAHDDCPCPNCTRERDHAARDEEDLS